MTKKTFLIPWFGVLTFLFALSLGEHSGPTEARDFRNQSSSIPTLGAFLSDKIEGGSASAIVGDQINYISQLSIDEDASPLRDVRYALDPSLGLTLADGVETSPLAYDDIYQLEVDSNIFIPAEVGVLAQTGAQAGITKESLAADQDFDATIAVSAVAETITTGKGSVNL